MKVLFVVCALAVAVCARPSGEDGLGDRAQYQFEYGVASPETGDIKAQRELRSGPVVVGEYALREADGTARLVSYRSAPQSGFEAVVQRAGVAVHPPQALVGQAGQQQGGQGLGALQIGGQGLGALQIGGQGGQQFGGQQFGFQQGGQQFNGQQGGQQFGGQQFGFQQGGQQFGGQQGGQQFGGQQGGQQFGGQQGGQQFGGQQGGQQFGGQQFGGQQGGFDDQGFGGQGIGGYIQNVGLATPGGSSYIKSIEITG